MQSRADMLPFEVDALVLDPASQSPVLLLRPRPGREEAEQEGQPLPIWIGIAEAAAIQSALEGRRPSRPMTHDLLAATIGQLDGELVAAIIHQLHEGTFHASLRVLRGDRLIDIDARASDAVALALRCEAEILVHPSVLEAVGQAKPQPEADLDQPELSELDSDAFGEYEM